MPIFEYKCQKCHFKFEKLIFGKSEKISCPKCGNKKTEKLFSTFSAKSSSTNFSANSKAGCGSCSSGTCSTCH